MTLIPSVCGNEAVFVPDEGCTDCELALEQIEQLREDFEECCETNTADIEDLDRRVTAIAGSIGAPTTAQTAADMIDHDKIYVYTGTETGYVNGDWYYWDGTAWVDGGTYSAVGYNIDDTLTRQGYAADAKATGDRLATKAEIDGYYQNMSVGNAEQLIGTTFEEDSVPYNFRTSGGSIDIGDREYDTVVGGTVAWNQQITADRKASYNSTASFDGRSGSFTATTQNGRVHYLFPVVDGHKYLGIVSIKTTTATTSVRMSWYGANNKNCVASTDWQTVSTIFSASSTSASWQLQIVDGRSSDWDLVEFKNVSLYDLTLALGTTIADYIYSLEQANAGAGVAWFKKLFPKDYYAYNAGELMSVNVSEHNTVGFNAWDEEWENGLYTSDTGAKGNRANAVRNVNPVRVLPNTSYYFKPADNSRDRNVAVYEYDINGDFIQRVILTATSANNPHTMSTKTHFVNFYWETALTTGTYDGTFCINLSWDGERNGEYEPYEKHSYPLDSSLTLRGIPKLDASNNLYYDGDVYESDGTVTRKYGVVDLGTLTWVSGGTNVFAASLSGLKVGTSGASPLICSKYIAQNISNTTPSSDKSVWQYYNTSNIRVYDTAYTDAATFKTAMSGVYLVYELATPTTETATPYTNPQIVDDFGTEEYVDYAYTNGDRDVAIPVGHVTRYQPNLRAKLEMMPNSPEGSGDYIVRQTNGVNEYVSLSSNATIQDILAKLPNAPSIDGTYTLTVTVSNGIATYSWE